MATSDDLTRRYADLLGDQADSKLVAFLGQLETLHETVPTPATLPATFDATALDAPEFQVVDLAKGTVVPMRPPAFATAPTATLSPSPRRPRWLALASVAAVLLLAFGSFAIFHGLGNPAGSGGAHLLPADTELHGIAMVSASEGWAIGEVIDPRLDTTKVSLTPPAYHPIQGLILHYQAGQWQRYTLALPKVTLLAIAMTGPDAGWIVGSTLTPGMYDDYANLPQRSTTGTLLLLHYAQGQWQQVQEPQFAGLIGGHIYPVSARESWLIGDVGDDTNVLFHEQQGQWSRVNLPSAQAKLQVDTLANAGTDDLWLATSHYLTNTYPNPNGALLHYHNGQWTTMQLAATMRIARIAFTSAHDGWAIGNTQVPGASYPVFDLIHPAALHYDGQQWQAVALPPPPTASQGVILADIALLPAGEVWITGRVILQDSVNGNGGIYHLLNGQWHFEAVNATAKVYSVDALAFTSASDGWAIGSRQISYPQSNGTGFSYPSLLLHFDGQGWQVVGD